MRAYHERNIKFLGIVSEGDWKIKYYSISVEDKFQSKAYVEYVKKQVPTLLESATKHHHEAFVIVHEASDGIWTILSWWTGEVMLRTHTFHSDSNQKLTLVPLSRTGSMACVWEMAVLEHEREAWIKYVLEKSEAPDFIGYEEEVINARV